MGGGNRLVRCSSKGKLKAVGYEQLIYGSLKNPIRTCHEDVELGKICATTFPPVGSPSR